MFSVLLFIFSVFIASVAQILMKLSADRKNRSGLKEYINPLVITAYCLLAGTTLMSVLALRRMNISAASALESLGQVFVALLGHFILKEKIGVQKAIGLFLIIIGIFIIFI